MRLAAHPRCSEHEVLWCRLGIGRLQVVRGELAMAIETLAPALPLCIGDLAIYFSRIASSLGAAYVGTGRVEDGIALLQKADDHAQAIGFAFGHALVLVQLGAAFLRAHDPDRAYEAGLRAVEMAQRWGECGNEAWARCLLGDIARLRIGTPGRRRIGTKRRWPSQNGWRWRRCEYAARTGLRALVLSANWDSDGPRPAKMIVQRNVRLRHTRLARGGPRHPCKDHRFPSEQHRSEGQKQTDHLVLRCPLTSENPTQYRLRH
jgi:tetratricopeptide (TPR) repeat protein